MKNGAGKKPRQARSQARVVRILDAAAEQIALGGLESLTMSGVGAASGSAPGSLYQFFPTRDLLIDALAEREASFVDACVADALTAWQSNGPLTAAALMDALLPPLLAIYRARPAWGELLHALARRGEPGAVEKRLDARISEKLSDALRHLAPHATQQRRELAAAILLELGHAGLQFAQSGSPEGALNEVRRALVAYLESWANAGV